MAFKDLKKSKISMLAEKLAGENSKSSSDERFWKPTMTKEGIASAIIRFLPAPEGESEEWVKMFTHGFQGPGGWYIENCRSTLGKDYPDPVNSYNRSLVMKYTDDGDLNKCPISVQKTVRNQKRKLNYYSNIYVIKDSANPENEGKVFLFRYGSKVFEKIKDALNPKFEEDEAFDPFHLYEGANFKLKVIVKDGYWNYDNSEFTKQCPLSDDDDLLESIYNKEYSLQEIVDPKNFKSYEDLEKKLNAVLGISNSTSRPRQQEDVEDDESEDLYTPRNSNSSGTSVINELEEAYKNSKPSSAKTNMSEDIDDAMDFFKGLIDD